MASAHPMQDRECFRVTLEKWLQLNVGVTWGNLELAITNANRESLGLQPLTTGKEYYSNICTYKSFLLYFHICNFYNAPYYTPHAILSISSIYMLSLSTVVLNSRDRPGNLWLPEISHFYNPP